MSRFKPDRILIALVALAILPGCTSTTSAQRDALPPLDSFHLEGNLQAVPKGQVILLDFWASWCAPCKNSFPAMQELHKQYAGRGLTIIAVNVDENRQDMERFLKAENVSFTILRDADQKLVAAAGVSAMPTSFLIDRAGKIRYVHKGFVGEATVRQYQEEIQLLLKEPAPSQPPEPAKP